MTGAGMKVDSVIIEQAARKTGMLEPRSWHIQLRVKNNENKCMTLSFKKIAHLLHFRGVPLLHKGHGLPTLWFPWQNGDRRWARPWSSLSFCISVQSGLLPWSVTVPGCGKGIEETICRCRFADFPGDGTAQVTSSFWSVSLPVAPCTPHSDRSEGKFARIGHARRVLVRRTQDCCCKWAHVFLVLVTHARLPHAEPAPAAAASSSLQGRVRPGVTWCSLPQFRMPATCQASDSAVCCVLNWKHWRRWVHATCSKAHPRRSDSHRPRHSPNAGGRARDLRGARPDADVKSALGPKVGVRARTGPDNPLPGSWGAARRRPWVGVGFEPVQTTPYRGREVKRWRRRRRP